MKYYKTSGSSRSAWVGMTRLLAVFFLIFSWNAQATAPRITSQMFGEEKKADIVGYQRMPLDATAKSEGELAVEIVTEAFKAAGKTPLVDVLPSKQLATYALFSNDAVALIGIQQDLAAKEKNQYRVVTFYLRGIAPDEKPVSLIFRKKMRAVMSCSQPSTKVCRKSSKAENIWNSWKSITARVKCLPIMPVV